MQINDCFDPIPSYAWRRLSALSDHFEFDIDALEEDPSSFTRRFAYLVKKVGSLLVSLETGISCRFERSASFE
eukprot:Seg443.6 transcript_id=Seg443.6/GoldUCD/mRNA.D3Y31 product="hypothetical protein" protein_id=Seg443.6/GoldUCD/D3Y31